MIKRKEQSFKKRLIISYIFLIVSIGLITSIIYYIYSFSMIEEQTVYAANSFKKLATTNAHYSQLYLEPIIKNYIRLKTEQTAKEISQLIKSGENIKANKKVEELSIQKIKSNGIKIGYMQLVDDKEFVIFSGDKKQVGKNLRNIKKNYKNLHPLLDNINKKSEFCGYYRIPTETKYLEAIQIPNTTYYLISSIVVHHYMDPILEKLKAQENEEVSILVKDINKLHRDAILILLCITLFILIILLCICLFISHWLAQKVSKPILDLENAVLKIGDGDFTTNVEEKGTTETIRLAKSFNKLGGRLNEYIENLKEEIFLRKQVESELKIARKIQNVLLPEVTSDYIRPEFTIFGDLIPAKNVAGDHFDFLYTDKEKNKLAIILGDVSDKGMAASLGMAVISTMIRGLIKTQRYDSPAELLKEVNCRICDKNPECIFDCLFLGFYDLKTSKLTYSNAGLHAALLVSKDGDVTEFGEFENTALGLLPDIEYKEAEITLLPDEFILIYTDGISEALSKTEEEYSVKRIKQFLTKNHKFHPKQIGTALLDNVLNFQDNIIYDDMTLLILRNNSI